MKKTAKRPKTSKAKKKPAGKTAPQKAPKAITGTPRPSAKTKAERKARAATMVLQDQAKKREELESKGFIIYDPDKINEMHNNKFWLLRSRHGLNPAMTPDDLIACAADYFHWATNTPNETPDGKKWKRPFTVMGFCMFAGIDQNTYYRYKDGEGYKRYWEFMSMISDAIKAQKFDGAAAGYFNAHLIARDLGLVDRQLQIQPPVQPTPAQPIAPGEDAKPTTEKDALAIYKQLMTTGLNQQ